MHSLNKPPKKLLSLPLALSGALLLGGLPADAAPPLYSFDDNRVQAHLDEGGLVVDAGSPGMLRYIRGNFGQSWKVDQTLDGQRVSLVSGKQGTLELPLSPRQAKAVRLELRYKALMAKQRVTVFVNDKNLGDLEVAESWHTGTKDIPAGLLKPGENTVRLTFRSSATVKGGRSAAALRWVRLALPGTEPFAEENGPLLQRSLQGGGLRLPRGGGLGWFLMPPAGSRLSLKAVAEAGATGCSLEVWAEKDGAAPYRVGGQDLGQTPASIDLDLKVGSLSALRLDLQEKGAAGCTGIKLLEPVLRKEGGRDLGSNWKKPRQVIFWLVDTLRADKLTVYNPRTRVKTPEIDALAKDAAIFTRYAVEGTESKVSHATLFTGVYPSVHQVLTEKASVPDKLVTIAEAFRDAKFPTAGIISNGYVSDAWNYHQGFQKYRNFIREGGANGAKTVLSVSLDWLKAQGTNPYYLYMGTIDCHVTYRLHKDILPLYDPDPYPGPFKRYLSGAELGKIKEGSLKITPRDKVRIEALYDNNVTYTDRHIGLLIQYLREQKALDDTLLLITGDHGDEFWEHGNCGHANGLYQEMVGVPLIIRYPGIFPAGSRIDVEGSGVDVMPTLLDAMGIPIPEQVQGDSLIPWVRGSRPAYPRAAISTHYEQLFSLRSGDLKLIHAMGGRTELYDLHSDPGEKQNLEKKRPVARRALEDPLFLFLAHRSEWKQRRWGAPTNLLPAAAKDLKVP